MSADAAGGRPFAGRPGDPRAPQGATAWTLHGPYRPVWRPLWHAHTLVIRYSCELQEARRFPACRGHFSAMRPRGGWTSTVAVAACQLPSPRSFRS